MTLQSAERRAQSREAKHWEKSLEKRTKKTKNEKRKRSQQKKIAFYRTGYSITSPIQTRMYRLQYFVVLSSSASGDSS